MLKNSGQWSVNSGRKGVNTLLLVQKEKGVIITPWQLQKILFNVVSCDVVKVFITS